MRFNVDTSYLRTANKVELESSWLEGRYLLAQDHITTLTVSMQSQVPIPEHRVGATGVEILADRGNRCDPLSPIQIAHWCTWPIFPFQRHFEKKNLISPKLALTSQNSKKRVRSTKSNNAENNSSLNWIFTHSFITNIYGLSFGLV